MNSLYYTKTEFMYREYEVEVEYEWEPEELATPTSPPSPARALIQRVSLMDKQPSGWVSVDVEKLLDAHQERMIQEEILDYVPRLGLPRPGKRALTLLTMEFGRLHENESRYCQGDGH